MIHRGEDISFKVTPVYYYGIELQQKPQSGLFPELGYSLFRLLSGSGLFPGYPFCPYLIWINLVLSDYSFYLPTGDIFLILLLIKDLEFLLTIVDILLSKLLYPAFLS